jgi:hypothetical protein
MFESSYFRSNPGKRYSLLNIYARGVLASPGKRYSLLNIYARGVLASFF